MTKRCHVLNLALFCLLWSAAEAVTVNGHSTDRSENELKVLSKRDAHNIDMLQEIDSEKGDESHLENFAKQMYDLYGEDEEKRALETAEDIDINNISKDTLPYLYLDELDDGDKSHYFDDSEEESLENGVDKRGFDRYSAFGSLGKRFRAPMGFSGRLGKRKSTVDDYDKRIPLGFVGTLGKRAPMGFMGQLGKRAPMGFMGQLGKRAPMGFMGQLGKRAPLGFRGQLGKRAPMGFLGTLGKRAPMGFLGTLGKRDPLYVFGPERRSPMGFKGRLGKRRGPMGFLGQLGKRET
ncbi:buccalin-like [Ruditapes philippinarum]|uniref:buccalin-like n=1 Tax=Ruditapes philippinarum TaxID=129788 RepID=UPI00295A85C6|nr:buccalin-like [Ruditapes philippinarum]